MKTLTRFRQQLDALPHFVVLAAPTIPPDTGLKAQVRDILESPPDRIYRDGIESVDRAEIVDGAIEGEFSDRVGVRAVKRVGFRIAPDSIETWILNPDEVAKFSAYQGDVLALFAPMFGKGSRAKAKNCTKGLSCGNGCIARGKKCSKNPSPQTKKKIEEILSDGSAWNDSAYAGSSPDLPKNHALGTAKSVTSAKLDEALRSLEDADNIQNLAKFRQFIANHTPRAVFHKQDIEATDQELEEIANEVGSSLSRVLPPAGTSNGYTHSSINHVNVSFDDYDYFEPDAKLIKLGIKDTIKNAAQNQPDWSFAGGSFTDSNRLVLTYFHEMGHQIHYKSDFSSSILDAPEGWKSLTKYGETKDTEFVAEHFIVWAIAPNQYKKADPIGYKYIDDLVDKAVRRND